jgi:hypothetical protein
VARFDDPEKDPPSLEPPIERDLAGPERWRLQHQQSEGDEKKLRAASC